MRPLGIVSKPKDPLNVMLLHFDTDFLANKYSGWLEEFRMRKDAAWTANFTPPTAAHMV